MNQDCISPAKHSEFSNSENYSSLLISLEKSLEENPLE